MRITDFEKYCELYDLIGSQEAGITDGSEVRGVSAGSWLLYSMGCVSAGSVPLEFMIGQADSKTLKRVRYLFRDNREFSELIDRRINFLAGHDEGNTPPNKEEEHEVKPDVFDYIEGWIKRKGFESDSAFYSYAGISRQLFAKIRSNDIAITRDRALHIAAALGLNYQECQEFLNYLGYSFTVWSRRDEAIIYVMRTYETYSLDDIDNMLILFHEKPFQTT